MLKIRDTEVYLCKEHSKIRDAEFLETVWYGMVFPSQCPFLADIEIRCSDHAVHIVCFNLLSLNSSEIDLFVWWCQHTLYLLWMTFEDAASVFCLLSFSCFTFSFIGKFHSTHCCYMFYTNTFVLFAQSDHSYVECNWVFLSIWHFFIPQHFC